MLHVKVNSSAIENILKLSKMTSLQLQIVYRHVKNRHPEKWSKGSEKQWSHEVARLM
jgi:hypothetical protein